MSRAIWPNGHTSGAIQPEVPCPAEARSQSCSTPITNNECEFKRIKQLGVENWTK
jgi:hypothetical protein